MAEAMATLWGWPAWSPASYGAASAMASLLGGFLQGPSLSHTHTHTQQPDAGPSPRTAWMWRCCCSRL